MSSFLPPSPLAEAYAVAGAAKTQRKAPVLFLLGILAGCMIAFGCAATSTAVYGLEDPWAIRTVCALLFPFGLAMVIVTGAELFTGNCLMVISALDRRCTVSSMVRSWCIVYLGNLVGSLLVASGCVFSGQLDYSTGSLAVYTIRLAATKCSLPLSHAVLSGFLCNILVTLAVLMAVSGKDNASRILGAYVPVCLFVLCGFEHCVANMYYIGAGLLALTIPSYAELVASAGLDLSGLTWGGFLLRNLLPVTLGNLAGGCTVGWLYWFCFLRGHREKP